MPPAWFSLNGIAFSPVLSQPCLVNNVLNCCFRATVTNFIGIFKEMSQLMYQALPGVLRSLLTYEKYGNKKVRN